MNIEIEGLLCRGVDMSSPEEIWDYPRERWVDFHGGRFGSPGRVINDAEAERLKVDNPAARHFMSYDTPPWRQPQSPDYLASTMPDAVNDMIRERCHSHAGQDTK